MFVESKSLVNNTAFVRFVNNGNNIAIRSANLTYNK